MSKKKLILSTIAILFVMFAAVSVVSYSIANLGHGDIITDNELKNYAAAPTGEEYVTCIDLILENAEKGEKLNVVEIVPNGVTAPTGLSNYSSSGYFAKNVLYAYRETYTKEFTDAQFKTMINYNMLSVDASTTLDKVITGTTTTYQSVLDAADLIYVSSPSYNSYTGDVNNMSEDILNYLRLYISADKPIVLDYVTSTSTATPAKITYETFANAVRNNFIKYRTYGWNSNYSAEDFFKLRKSYFLSYSVNKLTDRAPGTVLVITAGANTISSKMEGYADLIEYAYYGKDTKKPTKMTFTTWNVANNALTVDELNKKYDFIVIEGDVKSIEMDSTVYAKLKALSESSKYIIYDDSLISTTSSGTIEASLNNYLKMLQLYVSDKGVSQRANVLPVSPGFFDSLFIQGNDGVEGAKPVSDLLNGSDYRGSSTSGAASKKYRVLEIQPCYPIDLDVAQSNTERTTGFDDVKGGYYVLPDQVLSGVTADEIEEGTEYYAFEMSKAKIAYATGIPYDQIEVVQMSTNELISSKEVIAETYDFVYVGGNTSALTPIDLYRFDNSNESKNNKNFTWRLGFTGFNMYTHTGYLAEYHDNPGFKGTSMTYNRIPGGKNSVSYNGNDLTITKRDELIDYVAAGLPIIVDKQVVDAFEKTYDYDYDDVYGPAKANRLQQLSFNDIDPDCNMYQFLEYVYNGVKKDAKEKTEVFKNVGWGNVDSSNDNVKVENVLKIAKLDENGNEVKDENGEVVYEEIIDRAFGDTKGAEVTVFNPTTSTSIKTVKDNSKSRPTLVLSSHPKKYIETNATTKNTGNKVEFLAGVKTKTTDTSTYNLTLYVDEDGNGVFEDSEAKANGTCTNGGKDCSLSYSLDQTFFGLVSWKVKVESEDGTLSDVATGLSFFKPDDQSKKEISVLQIMPVDSIDDFLPEGVSPATATEAQWNTAFTDWSDEDYIGSGEFSMYFCTECQMSGKLLNHNVTINQGDQLHKKSFTEYKTIWTEYGGTPVQLGKHEHDFGIVEYDTIKGDENWESNFADDLTRGSDGSVATGEYEFDLDIMTVPQLETLCSQAKSGIADCKEVATAPEDLCYTENATTKVKTYKSTGLCDACAAEYQDILKSDYDASLKLLEDTYAYKFDSTTDQWAGHALNEAFFKVLDDMDPSHTFYNTIAAGIGERQKPGDWILNQEYYKFWEYFNDTFSDSANYPNNCAKSAQLKKDMDTLAKLYNAYVTQRNTVIDNKEKYKAACYQYGDADTWLINNYDVVVFGFANEFNSKDLTVDAAQQIKAYIDQGGAVLNTHETLTTRAGTAVNMSAVLRETFGMDRFHVVDFSKSDVVTVQSPKAANQTFVFGRNIYYDSQAKKQVREGAKEIVISDQDITITLPAPKEGSDGLDFNDAKIEYGAVHTSLDEKVKVTIKFEFPHQDKNVGFERTFYYYDVTKEENNGGSYNRKMGHEINGDSYTFEFAQKAGSVSGSFSVGETNLSGSYDVNTGQVIVTTNDTAVDEGKVNVELTVKNGENAVEDGVNIKYFFRDAEQTVATQDGKISFTVDLTQQSTQGLLTTPTGVKYRRYATKDPTKYFWTERLKAASPMDYATAIANTPGLNNDIYYNAPLGLTDFYVAYDTRSEGDVSPFLYAMNEVDHYEQNDLESDGNGTKYHYGTRKAEIVNQGGVTMYPFSISDTMLTSPTHPQTFALDLEDEDVAVWYTLTGSAADSNLSVTADDVRRVSAFFAASPKDGMSNYFLYSKGSVFFTGAGHQTITGPGKDNNDERKLFINVIVNSAIRGKYPPALNLYNKCEKADCATKDTRCSCYVDPNQKTPEKVPVNTLYYNDKIGMYQYDIEDDGTDVYPEFDFKVLAGSADLKDIQVFYDLDYEKTITDSSGESRVNRSDMYANDTYHKLITSYSPAANQDGVRIQLRKDVLKDKLLLEKEYMEPYNNFTYIVVRAKDMRGQTVSARIKINVIPYLFDLTDAGSEVVNSSFDSLLLDMSDRKFNI